MFRAVLDYRNFIISSVMGEFKSRFARSRLGGIWMILNPLAQVAIYAIVLSHLMSSRLQGVNYKYSYIIYLMAEIKTIETNNSKLLTRELPKIMIGRQILGKISFFSKFELSIKTVRHLVTISEKRDHAKVPAIR